MPRKSSYEISLSTTEERQLRKRAAKYTLPYFQVVRAKMVLLAAQGLSNNEIAASLGTRREVVSLWRKRFFEERLAGLEERPRPGRPRRFSPRTGHSGQKLSPVNCTPLMICPYLAEARRTSLNTWLSQASSLRSAVARFGDGCTRTPFVLGNIELGSSLATRTLP